MLTEKQTLTLQAVTNRIIPPDEVVGAWEAGVGDYILGQFQRDFKSLVRDYQAWLDSLEQESQAVMGMSFHELEADIQDLLLSQIEKAILKTEWTVDAAVFFALLVEHCAEGFYSDAGNGGNRDHVSWRMIGFKVRA